MARKLVNVGPRSRKWLAEIGVRSREDLERLGAVMAYRILKQNNPAVTINMLYGLEAALTGRKWTDLTPEERGRLRREADEDVEIRIEKPRDDRKAGDSLR